MSEHASVRCLDWSDAELLERLEAVRDIRLRVKQGRVLEE